MESLDGAYDVGERCVRYSRLLDGKHDHRIPRTAGSL